MAQEWIRGTDAGADHYSFDAIEDFRPSAELPLNTESRKSAAQTIRISGVGGDHVFAAGHKRLGGRYPRFPESVHEGPHG